MSLWQKYRASDPKTRLLLGTGLMVWGAVGLFTAAKTEQALDMVPTDQDKEKWEQSIPKIRIVERGEGVLGERK